MGLGYKSRIKGIRAQFKGILAEYEILCIAREIIEYGSDLRQVKVLHSEGNLTGPVKRPQTGPALGQCHFTRHQDQGCVEGTWTKGKFLQCPDAWKWDRASGVVATSCGNHASCVCTWIHGSIAIGWCWVRVGLELPEQLCQRLLCKFPSPALIQAWESGPGIVMALRMQQGDGGTVVARKFWRRAVPLSGVKCG